MVKFEMFAEAFSLSDPCFVQAIAAGPTFGDRLPFVPKNPEPYWRVSTIKPIKKSDLFTAHLALAYPLNRYKEPREAYENKDLSSGVFLCSNTKSQTSLPIYSFESGAKPQNPFVGGFFIPQSICEDPFFTDIYYDNLPVAVATSFFKRVTRLLNGICVYLDPDVFSSSEIFTFRTLITQLGGRSSKEVIDDLTHVLVFKLSEVRIYPHPFPKPNHLTLYPLYPSDLFAYMDPRFVDSLR